MYLLSLDLGRTTGWGLWKDENHAFKYGQTTDIEALFMKIREYGQPKHVVVEKPVVIRGPLGDEMTGLIARTEAEYGDSIIYVTAAQWKPHPLVRDFLHEIRTLKVSVHTRDALCIGCYALNFCLQGQA